MSGSNLPSFLTKVACGGEKDYNESDVEPSVNHGASVAVMKKSSSFEEVDKETAASLNYESDECKLSLRKDPTDKSLSPSPGVSFDGSQQVSEETFVEAPSPKEDAVTVSQRRAAEREDAEETHFLQILPLEIWTMVADLMNDYKSMESLSNSSPFFRKMLKDRRVDFLAPEAIKLIVQNEYLDMRGWNLSLDLRKVCKSWCLGVDTLLEEHPSNTFEVNSPFHNWCELYYGYLSWETYIEARCLDDAQTGRRFLNHFESTHANTNKNPFLGRTIEVSTREGVFEVYQILKMYGSHVWSLRISYDEHMIDVDNLRIYLLALPNLRKLDMNYSGFETNPRICRLPLMPNLDTFRGYLDVALQSGIVRDNSSIVNLKADMWTYTDLRPVVFPHVKQLEIYLHFPTHSLTNQRPLYIKTDELSKLTLYTSSYESLPCKVRLLRWKLVFKFINRNWGRAEHLTEVELALPRFISLNTMCMNLERAYSYRLKLKNVEHMKLEIHSPTSLDFLLPMRKSLKTLHVRLWNFIFEIDPSEEIGKTLALAKRCQIVQVLGFEERLYESNIWFKFPKLQKVIFEGQLKYATKAYKCGEREKTRVYTRREWERFSLG